MQANRAVVKAQKAGVPLSDLPPPPPDEFADADDRVPCPNCGRKFNSDVAARHIPRCKVGRALPRHSRRSTSAHSRGGAATDEPTLHVTRI